MLDAFFAYAVMSTRKHYDVAKTIKPKSPTCNVRVECLTGLGSSVGSNDAALFSAHVWFNKGCSLSMQNKFQESVECYAEALRFNPNYAPAWANKGLSLYNLGRLEEALECFVRVLEVNPTTSDVLARYGANVNVKDKYGRTPMSLAKGFVREYLMIYALRPSRR